MIQLVMWYNGLLITVKNFIAQQIITEEDLEDLSSFIEMFKYIDGQIINFFNLSEYPTHTQIQTVIL